MKKQAQSKDEAGAPSLLPYQAVALASRLLVPEAVEIYWIPIFNHISDGPDFSCKV